MPSRVQPRKRTRHKEVFFAHNGPGPYPCAFCGEPVTFDEVLVHHVDENRENHEPTNLVASHFGCHTRHHAPLKKTWEANRGVPKSAESRRKMSEAKKRYWAEKRAAQCAS